ncbi:hypothetical protein [Serratia microhaemolytica]|uniref:hypothetical protein n=1 Tax=Serratia microhaemolytica TaxID=2675110 RepID=UPI000FDE3274|nr:hypothetical protein [Serratia microhaemolytica]
MSIHSTGEQNRIAGRDFIENTIQIDQFDGRHTINIALPVEKEEIRPLVPAQRKELNDLVIAIAKESGKEPFLIWQKVHAEIGVNSIKNMTSNHYQGAWSFLNQMLEHCKEKGNTKALVRLLLRNSEGEEGQLRKKLTHYCCVSFGSGRFNDLTRIQLQQALSWLDELKQKSEQPPVAQGGVQPEVTAPQPAQAAPSLIERLSMSVLLRTYSKELGLTFILGMLLGALLFRSH